MLKDFTLAWRSLVRSPGTFAAMVLSLAVGIGVNASAFIGVNALTLHPLPFTDLDRIVTIWESANGRADRDPVAPANFLDWQEQQTAFERVAAARSWFTARTDTGDPEPVRGMSISPDFFAVLGVPPRIGRTFTPAEAEPGAPKILV